MAESPANPLPEPGNPPDPDVAAPVTREAVLGAFLRAHRERLAPDDVGLPRGRRRRTPGLRREEVPSLPDSVPHG